MSLKTSSPFFSSHSSRPYSGTQLVSNFSARAFARVVLHVDSPPRRTIFCVTYDARTNGDIQFALRCGASRMDVALIGFFTRSGSNATAVTWCPAPIERFSAHFSAHRSLANRWVTGYSKTSLTIQLKNSCCSASLAWLSGIDGKLIGSRTTQRTEGNRACNHSFLIFASHLRNSGFE